MSYPQLPQTTFRAINDDRITGDVINPGAWFGKVFVIEIGCGISSIYFAVEANSEDDAIDEFADSEYGHLIKIADDDMSDYNEDTVYRAGNDGAPVDLDHLHISRRAIRYYAPYLWSAGITPKQYDRMQSADKFDNVWGDEKPIAPDNYSCRYVDLRFPVIAPNAKGHHRLSAHISYGDIVAYRENDCHTIGRAFGIMTKTGMGESTNGMFLMVMQMSDSLSHCYLRSIAIGEIIAVCKPSEFLRWFFGSQLGDSQSLLSYANYGSLNDRYIVKYLDSCAQLRPVKRPFHCVDIAANIVGGS